MVRQPPCPRCRVGVLLGPARPGERSDLSPTKDRSDDIGKNARSEFPMVSRSGRSRWLSWRRRSWRTIFVVEERTAEGGIKVRTVATDESATIDIIADRMRLTLVEVLDGARADAMFRRNELVDRVRWHLERSDPDRRAEVFVAEEESGNIVGHTMVRVESDPSVGSEPVGLFATTYVDPGSRRSGIASALLSAGEGWMRDEGMTTAMTFTDPANAPLLALYARHGYLCERIDDTWARASRAIA
jgi:GNAT superfamily N-acetyltransferase